MSSNISDRSEIANRILVLVGHYGTQKAFLEACGIGNHSYVSDLKRGKNQDPGAEILAKIVRGTGCSGTWLLTGEGEKFPPERPRENEAPPEDYMADFMQARRLIESIEQRKADLKDNELLLDLAEQCSQLTAKLLKIRREEKS
jgi:transcriptional regulator with XRE-family HTH domain